MIAMHLALTAHIFFATLGFGMAIALELMLVAAGRSGQIDGIRTAYLAASRFRPAIGLSLLLAIVLGFYLAISHGASLTAGWLLLSYVLILLAAIITGGIIQRRNQRMLALIARSNGTMTDELRQAAAAATPLAAVLLLVIMFVLIGAMIH